MICIQLLIILPPETQSQNIKEKVHKNENSLNLDFFCRLFKVCTKMKRPAEILPPSKVLTASNIKVSKIVRG